MLKKVEDGQNIHPTQFVERYCFEACRMNFVTIILENGSAPICALQWTNDYSIAWSSSRQQIRISRGFRIGPCDLLSNMHGFLSFLYDPASDLSISGIPDA
jgi:hypothetical protein